MRHGDRSSTPAEVGEEMAAMGGVSLPASGTAGADADVARSAEGAAQAELVIARERGNGHNLDFAKQLAGHDGEGSCPGLRRRFAPAPR
jgi:hypothetical protein